MNVLSCRRLDCVFYLVLFIFLGKPDNVIIRTVILSLFDAAMRCV